MHTPTFCVLNNVLYVGLTISGRFIKINLDSYNATELSVPWAYLEYGPGSIETRWKNTNNCDPHEPLCPSSYTYAPYPDGKLWVGTMIYNMPSAALYSFTVDSGALTIESKILSEKSIPSESPYINENGELTPISEMRLQNNK
jgi:hypothetical protein